MATKRKLVRGVDYDGWAWEFPDGFFGVFLPSTDKPLRLSKYGQWVRAKLVKAKGA